MQNRQLYTIQEGDNGTKFVTGNTFVIKDTLKQMKGTWVPTKNAWMLPADSDLNLLPKFKVLNNKNTFELKEMIKDAGGIWDNNTKTWFVPETFDEKILMPKQSEPEPEIDEVICSRAKKACSLCRQEGHTKNSCICPHCKSRSLHKPGECPTIHPNYKKSDNCACSCYGLCDWCSIIGKPVEVFRNEK